MARIKMDMTEGNILPKLIKFALPIMVTSVIHQLFSTADTIVVGRWGGATPVEREIALSAVGSCGPMISMLITFFMGLSIGAGVLVSHEVGAKQEDKLDKIVHTSVSLALTCGAVLSVLGFVFARPLLIFMNTPDAVMDQATLYMRAYFCGIPAQLLYNYCAAMLRATGDSVRPMLFLTVSGVANVVLNLIMVIGFEQGALGVGVATAVSQCIASIMILVYMRREDVFCRLSLRKLKFHLPTLRKVLSQGVPAGIHNCMFAVGNLVMQTALNSFNNTVYVSGSSIASTVGAYTQLICGGMVSAAYTFVGQNTGAKDIERIRKCVRISAITITVSAIAMNTVLNLVSAPILALFAPNNAEVVEFAKLKLLVNSSFYFLSHLESLYGYAMRGMGKSTTPMLISVAGSCGVRVIWIYTVFVWIRHPLTIFFAYSVSWFIAFVGQFVFYQRLQKKLGEEWNKQTLTKKQVSTII